jgi:hypothetical protein
MRFLLNVSTNNEETAIKPSLQAFLRAIGDPENEVGSGGTWIADIDSSNGEAGLWERLFCFERCAERLS